MINRPVSLIKTKEENKMDEKLFAIKATIVAAYSALGAFLGWKGLMLLTWVILMALDWISGTFAAMKNGEWTSKKSREGAWHKGGAVLVVIVAVIADLIMLVICGNIPVLDITWPNIILPLVLAWYILTELGSILENAIKLGANPPTWLSKILQTSLNAVESVGEAAQNGMEKTERAQNSADAYGVDDLLKDVSGLLDE